MNIHIVAQIYAEAGFFQSIEHAVSVLAGEERVGVRHISIFDLDARKMYSAYSVYFDEKKASGHIIRMGTVKDTDKSVYNMKGQFVRKTPNESEREFVYTTLLEQAEMRLRDTASEKKTLIAAIVMLVAFADQRFIALTETKGYTQSVMKGEYITMIKMVKE